MRKCCWDDCEEPRKQKKSFSGKDETESTYRYCEYHNPIMKRTGRYNVDKYEVERLISKTNCDLCGRHFDVKKKEPKIDHCHTTGVVRGVLCSSCNTGLGLLGDNKESLIKALHYLEPKSGCFIPHEPVNLEGEAMPWE